MSHPVVLETPDPKSAHIVTNWGHDRPLISCRFDPSGQLVYAGAEDALVGRFKMPDGARTLYTGGHSTWVNAFAFSADGKTVISGGCDGKLTWWPVEGDAPAPIRSVAAHGTQWVRSVVSSPDGSLLASGGNDRIVRLWNPADGTMVKELSVHEKHVYSVLFHPNGTTLFSGDLGGHVRQWEIATGAEIKKFDATPLYSFNGGQQVDFGGVRALAVSADGKWLAAGGLHKATNPLGAVHEPLIILINLETGAVERQLIAEGITGGVIWRLKWLADGSLMGVSGGSSGGWLFFWKPETEKDYHRFQLPNLARDMDLAPDGITVVTAHHDRNLRITRLAPKAA